MKFRQFWSFFLCFVIFMKTGRISVSLPPPRSLNFFWLTMSFQCRWAGLSISTSAPWILKNSCLRLIKAGSLSLSGISVLMIKSRTLYMKTCSIMSKLFWIIGGIPAAVRAYTTSGDITDSSSGHENILQAYEDDFGKYRKRIYPRRLRKVFYRLPSLIGKKLKYVNIGSKEKARDLADSLPCGADQTIIVRGGRGKLRRRNLNRQVLKTRLQSAFAGD